jgi:hypothetical protein
VRAVIVASLAGIGMYLLYTSLALGRTGFGWRPERLQPWRKLHEEWMVQAGLGTCSSPSSPAS